MRPLTTRRHSRTTRATKTHELGLGAAFAPLFKRPTLLNRALSSIEERATPARHHHARVAASLPNSSALFVGEIVNDKKRTSLSARSDGADSARTSAPAGENAARGQQHLALRQSSPARRPEPAKRAEAAMATTRLAQEARRQGLFGGKARKFYFEVRVGWGGCLLVVAWPAAALCRLCRANTHLLNDDPFSQHTHTITETTLHENLDRTT